MNIFYLNESPETCAQMHCDKHVVKMIIEYAQLLSTAHRVIDGNPYYDKTKNGRKILRYRMENPNLEKTLYKAAMINHPSAVWARQNPENYIFLYDLFDELCAEYTWRYGKTHSTENLLSNLLSRVPENIPEGKFFEPPQCMPDDVKATTSIQAYHNYYNKYKSYFAKWTNRTTPDWYGFKADAGYAS